MSDTALEELYSEIIEETWGGASMRRPPLKGGHYAPNEVKNQYTSQQVKIGTTEMNPMTVNVNPDEQEEVVSGSIDKRKLFDMIDSLSTKLDSSNNNDRGALIVLSKLKKLIK